MCGKRTHKNWATAESDTTVFELKAHIENIFARLGFSGNQLIFESVSNPLFDTAMNIRTHQREIGVFGVLSQKTCKPFDIDTEVFYAELNWDNIIKENTRKTVKFTEISKFPAVSRDLALLIDKNITFAQIEEIAKKSEKKLLKKVSLFDVYEGKNLPEGKKSYAVNFMLQDTEKTLNDKQIDAIMQKIKLNLEKELGAQLR